MVNLQTCEDANCHVCKQAIKWMALVLIVTQIWPIFSILNIEYIIYYFFCHQVENLFQLLSEILPVRVIKIRWLCFMLFSWKLWIVNLVPFSTEFLTSLVFILFFLTMHVHYQHNRHVRGLLRCILTMRISNLLKQCKRPERV